VKVGDILKVYSEFFFPADLLLLSSSEPEALCYVETSNLDGYFPSCTCLRATGTHIVFVCLCRETNLKIRQGVKLTSKMQSPDKIYEFKGEFSCEGPNNRLYNFDGTLKCDGESIPVGPNQVLLRV